MPDKGRRLISLTLTLTLLTVGILSMRSNIVRGQELIHESVFPEGTDPDGPDRLTRIEQQLQKLQAQNRHLQKRYDTLTRKYELLLKPGNDPVFGGSVGNSDGMGIPNGLNLRPTAAFLQDKGRLQTGEGGAGVASGDKESSSEPKTNPEEDIEQATPKTPTSRRAQTGTGGGSGEVIEPVTPALVADYVNKRGPYNPGMRPLRMPGVVSFREGIEIRAPNDFFTLEFHNLTQADYREL